MNLDDEAERIAALHPCAGWSIFGRVGPWQPEHAVPKRPPRERLTEAQIANRVAMDLAAMDGGWQSEAIDNLHLGEFVIRVDLDKTMSIAIRAMEALNNRLDSLVVHPTAMTREQCTAWARSGFPLVYTSDESAAADPKAASARPFSTKRHHKRQAWMQGERQRREAKRR